LTWFEETESLLFNAPSSAGIVSSIHNTALEVWRRFLCSSALPLGLVHCKLQGVENF
jgi:hypothetical protein